MKTPKAFIYAVLIAIAVLGAALLAKSQTDQVATNTKVKGSSAERLGTVQGTDAEEESASKPAEPKADRDADK